MILGTRPSIGWLGYIVVGKSPFKIILLLICLAAFSLMLLRRSKESITLQFMTPVLGRTSVVILPPPLYKTFNSFDACAVESATKPPLSNNMPEETPTQPRPVLLYMWASNVAPNDMWVKVVAKIKGIKLLYMNLVKSIAQTPIQGMVEMGGWGGRPHWSIWLAAGGSLLYKSGGILMPTSVLMTKPIGVDAFGNNSGLLVASSGLVHPVAFGSPPHHLVLDHILDHVQNFDHKFYDAFDYTAATGTPLEHFVTKSVTSACEIQTLGEMRDSLCGQFNVMSRSTVFDVDLQQTSSLNEESASFLRFTGDPETLMYDLGQSKRFFRKHGLVRYCPQVYHFLEYEANKFL